MVNQKGNSTLVFILILFLTSFGILKVLENKINHISNLNKKMEHALCTKNTNGEILKFTSLIEKTNKMLMLLTIGKFTLSLFPGWGKVIGGLSSKNAISALKTYQYKQYVSYLNYGRLLLKKNCYLSPKYIKSPYKLGLTGFKRDKFNQTKARGKFWKIKLLKLPYISEIRLNIRKNKTKTIIKQVLLPSTLSLF